MTSANSHLNPLSPGPGARSLRVRLVLWLTGICAVSALALLIGARIYGGHAADRAFDRILHASALAIAEQVYVRNGRVAVDLPYASLDMLGFARDDRVFYRVVNPAGATVTGYAGLPAPPGDPVRGEPVFFDAPYRGDTVRFVALGRLLAEPGLSGWAMVQVGQTQRARQALAREMALSATAPIVVFMLAIVALVWFGVSRGLAPLHRVEAELERRRSTELAPLSVAAPREIFALVHAINDFMGRLQLSFDQMQRFIADAAHQIRTPLASLKAQAELARDEDDPQRLRHHLDRIEHNAALTTRLTNQLLSNAVITHRANLGSHEPMDLAETLRQAVREAVPLAGERVEDLVVDLAVERAPLRGDPVAIREALRNLIENALQHGPRRGEVRIELRAADGGYACTVADRGAGIPAAERERVLERFQRGDDASGPGSGLGLAIVREVAEQHRGALRLEDRAGGGLRVVLQLPGDAP